jgi:hypothetical protein
MPKTRNDISPNTPYKTPKKTSGRKITNASKKPRYLWNKVELEKIKEGSNKGWKAKRIKDFYFGGTTNPTSGQIDTQLKKIVSNSSSLVNSGLNNIPNFGQDNTVGKKLNLKFFNY